MARQAQVKKKQEIFLEALEKNLGNITGACRATGIPRRTVYNWLKKYPEFKEAVDEMDEVRIDFVESKLFQKINEGNVAAQIFFLKTQAKHRGYVERVEVQNEVPEKIEIEIIKPAGGGSRKD